MKILFLTLAPKIAASSRTRVYQYLPFLKKGGINYKLINYETGLLYRLHALECKNLIGKLTGKLFRKACKIYNPLFSTISTLWLLILANFYDLIFIQKVLLPDFIVRLLKKKGKKIIFDFDDALFAHPGTYNKRRFDNQIPLYDLVVLENSYTKAYVNKHGNENVLMLTGPIDCNRYCPKDDSINDKVVIGWIGSPSTEKYLKILQSVFQKLCAGHKNVLLELIGVKKVHIDGVNLVSKKWNWDTEIANLQNFDIGIMPLPDNEWTKGKGGYKLLQYMAVGIPYVTSPVGINKQLTREGENGFLATTEDEWYQKILLLIENPVLRKKMGMKGRQLAIKNYSIKVLAPKLLSSLKNLENTNLIFK